MMEKTASLDLPQVTVLIENPCKSSNWGPLFRCCTAFGITQIFAIGLNKCTVRGSHGAAKHVDMVAFHDHTTALRVLKDELGFTILGLLQGAPEAYGSSGYDVQGTVDQVAKDTVVRVKTATTSTGKSGDELFSFPASLPLHCRPFAQRTCLVVGKRPKGLQLSLARLCDQFVHIPHQGLAPLVDEKDTLIGLDATWLSVEAGLSIVLHEFALWAGYGQPGNNEDRKVMHYYGQKYDVASKRKGETTKEEQMRIQNEREAQREDASDAHFNLFESDPAHPGEFLDDIGDY